MENENIVIKICPCCLRDFKALDDTQVFCDDECEQVAKANPKLFKKAQKEGFPLL